MIKHFDITYDQAAADPAVEKYLKRKIGHVDRYLSRHTQSGTRIEAVLGATNAPNEPGVTCQLTLYLPNKAIRVSETNINMYAAIDIVELKLKQQLQGYRRKRAAGFVRRRLLRFKRRTLSPAEPIR